MTQAMKKTQQAYDSATIRADFPSLSRDVNGQKVVFLDTAASALKPSSVTQAMSDMMAGEYANIHRGLYQFSASATAKFEAARGKVATFINALHENSVIFTRNATESINLVAQSWGRANLSAGDVVLITAMEHHANIVPWHMVCEQTGARLEVVAMNDDGSLNTDDFNAKINNPDVKMLAFSAMSNALGTVNPVADMVAQARASGVVTLVDACQAVMHGVVDVQAWECDFMVFSGHKLYGPSGIGVLYGRENLLNAMPPYQGGGDMIDVVSFETGITYKNAPSRFEAGTPALVEAVGLGAAIDYLSAIGMDAIAAHEADLYAYLCDEFAKLDGVRLIGRAQNRASVLSFVMDGIHPQDIGVLLDKQGVAVRVGHHCAMPVMERMGIDGTVRASIGLYNTRDDVDAFIAALKKVQKFF